MKSNAMQLSRAERSWLPWRGVAGKLRLGWSCWINRATYPIVEKIFEGIACSRHNHILLWVNAQWDLLGALAQQINQVSSAGHNKRLGEWVQQAPDFSELFIIDTQGVVQSSTYAPRIGMRDLNANAVAAGLSAPFLHGPYSDPVTKNLGATTSSILKIVFKAAVTTVTR